MRTTVAIGRLACVYLACCIIIAIFLGEIALHPQRVPVDRKSAAEKMAAPFGAMLQDVSISAADGTKLQGWFARPTQAVGDAVILLHGIGDNRQGMVEFAELFLSQGYSVLLPDSRGQGASNGLPTYGIRERSDIRLWFDWLQNHEKPRRIYGMGESMGAAILLQSIKEVDFCAVVAESPFASFRDIAYVRVGQFFDAGIWVGRTVLRPAVEFAFLYCRIRCGVWLANASPELSTVGSRVPVLLIHGSADDNIPLRQSEMIFKRSPGNIDFWKVPNAGHCGALNAAGPEFARRVLGWFSSHGVISLNENSGSQFLHGSNRARSR